MVLHQIRKYPEIIFSKKCQGCGNSIKIGEERDIIAITHGVLVRGYFVAIEDQ